MNKDIETAKLKQRIAKLEKENAELREFRDNELQQEKERLIMSQELEFSWADNLGIWDWNVKTGNVVFNAKKVEALGFSVDEFVPNVYAFTERLHPDDYEHTMNVMKKHLEGSLPLYEVEYRIRKKDGNWKWFYDRGKIVERDNDGSPLRVTGIVFDISERKELEAAMSESMESLKLANDSMSRFFSIVSHDLRAPIGNLHILLNLVKEGILTLKQEEFLSIVNDIEKSVRSVHMLLENLLVWTRSNIQGETIQNENINLHSILLEIKELFEIPARDKRISIILQGESNVKVFTEKNMLSAVIRNLLSNAIKFSYPDSVIYINSSVKDGYVEINVIDEGQGIDNRKKSEIFNPGKIISTRGTDDERGAGLGLVLCYEFVKKIGGDINVKSERGKGSTFTVVIPIH
ncbi:MAG: PAS domain-containing sensor histidine kinase [Spirochaetota bacterium]